MSDAKKENITVLPTHAQQRAVVMDLLSSGLTQEEIARFANEKEKWALSRNDIRRLIREARKKLIASLSLDPQFHIALSTHRLNQLYARCMQVQDYKGALAVERAHIELFRLYDAVQPDEPLFKQIEGELEQPRLPETPQ